MGKFEITILEGVVTVKCYSDEPQLGDQKRLLEHVDPEMFLRNLPPLKWDAQLDSEEKGALYAGIGLAVISSTIKSQFLKQHEIHLFNFGIYSITFVSGDKGDFLKVSYVFYESDGNKTTDIYHYFPCTIEELVKTVEAISKG